YLFFFSSRRRHTRLVSDWSSDVCSSDLGLSLPGLRRIASGIAILPISCRKDRKSVVSGKSVDLGGRRIIKKKKNHQNKEGGPLQGAGCTKVHARYGAPAH